MERHPQLTKDLNNLLGFDLAASIQADRCAPPPVGCGGVAAEFRDEVSRREFSISGLCQKCQDGFFNQPESQEETPVKEQQIRRIMACEADHQFMAEPGDGNEFHSPHVGCGAMITSESAEITDSDLKELFQCHICNAPELAKRWAHGKELQAKQLCFLCHFWQEKVQWRNENNPQCFVINGQHIKVIPDEPEGQRRWSGCGGSKFVILAFDGRRIVTHNKWHQGKVPDRFRHILTDNARYES